MVVLISNDLMFPSQISSAARSLGIPCQTLGSIARLAEISEPIKLALVDLATATAPIDRLLADLRGAAPHAKAVAYGPHVQAGQLAAAREAGFDQVVTRGQLASQMVEILTSANVPDGER